MPKYDFNKVACIFSEHLFLRTPLNGCFCIKKILSRSKQTSEVKYFEKIKLPLSSPMLIIFARK